MDVHDLRTLAVRHQAEELAEQSRTLRDAPRPLSLEVHPPGPQTHTWLERVPAPKTQLVVDPCLSFGHWVVSIDRPPLSIVDTRADQPLGGWAPDLVVNAYFEGQLASVLCDVHAVAEMQQSAKQHPRSEALHVRLEALVARFPDLLTSFEPTHDGYRLIFVNKSVRDTVVAQGRYRGAFFGREGPTTIALRATKRLSARARGRIVDALRGAMKWLEAHPGERSPDWVDVPDLKRPRKRGTAPSYREVGADEREEMLNAVVDMEARVYEPARRDSREKLGLAFHDPDGIAIVAEADKDGSPLLVGFALGTPLERIEHTRGPEQDPMRGHRNTLYALSLATDSAFQGFGMGRQLKTRLIAAAAARQNADGSPRYYFCCGRQRVGAADAMIRINRSLGAAQVALYDNEYGGEAQAWYYRQPVRTFQPMPVQSATPDKLSLKLDRALIEPPSTLHALYRGGGLFGPLVHGLQLGRHQTTASLRAFEWLLASEPDRQTLEAYPSLEELLEDLDGPLVTFEGTDIPGAQTIVHPEADPEGAEAALEQLGKVSLIAESTQLKTGRMLPAGFLASVPSEVELIGLDIASAMHRTGSFGAPLPSRAVRAWVVPGMALRFSRGSRNVQAHHLAEYPLVLTHHILRWLADQDLHEATRSLESALRPIGGTMRGQSLYRVVETGDARQIGDALVARGCEIDYDDHYLRFAPPFDFGERYLQLEKYLREIAGEDS